MKNFKFFRGITNRRSIGLWWPENDEQTDVVVNHLAEELSRQIDEDIVVRLTRRINGGRQLDIFEEMERNLNGIGGNRA
jgi:hypothetical protein